MHKEIAPFATYEAVLSSLKNPRGERICHSPTVIHQLWEIHADVADLVTLFQLKDDQGNERFFAHAVVTFVTHGGYTTKDLVQVAKLVDHTGKPILRSSNQFYDFMKHKRSVQDAQKIAALKDSEGLTIFRNDTTGGNFDGFQAIADALNLGVTPESIEELLQLKDHNGTTLFRTPREIIRLLEYKGTPQFAQTLYSQKGHEGNAIFDAFTIALYKQYQGSLEFAQKIISLTDSKGHTIFSVGQEIVAILRQHACGNNRRYSEEIFRQISKIASYTDTQKQTLFRDGIDIVDILAVTKGDLRILKPYIAILGEDGQTYFKGYEIALLIKHQVPASYAAKLAQQKLNALSILYNFHLGLTDLQTSFNYSGKPKALIVYPTDDPVDMNMNVFRDEDTFALLSKFRDKYDCKIRAVSSVSEFLTELDAAKDIYFLIIGGHGQQRSLRFGSSIPKYDIIIEDTEAQLTPKHTELQDYFTQLPLLHTILLDSCLSGEGREEADNMVNFIARQARGVQVIGSTEPTNAKRVKILSFYPPVIELLGTRSYTDSTYVHKIDN